MTSSCLAAAWPVGAAIRRWSDRTAALAAQADARETQARDEERARIARELHDVVSHSLGVVLVQAEAAEAIAGSSDERVRERIERIRSTGSGALADMRRVLGLLRDAEHAADTRPQPGAAALPDLIDRVRSTGLHVALNIDGPPPPLSPSMDLALYRIVQEGLTNTLRHAHATRVDLDIRYAHTQWRSRSPTTVTADRPTSALVRAAGCSACRSARRCTAERSVPATAPAAGSRSARDSPSSRDPCPPR